jgi:Na+-translocating ferredoxin:NAD+ oxidoreductase subunit D
LDTRNLTVSSSPHLHAGGSVRGAMLHVLLALAPATVFAVYYFGMTALLTVITGVVVAVMAEAFLLWAMKKPVTAVRDGSAAVTGLLLALNLPAGIALWLVAIGAGVAIGVGKMVFGGIGHNPFNPALVGRAVLVVSWPARMTAWMGPGLISAATPLALYRETGNIGNYRDLFFGFIPGSIGEVSALLLLVGGLYLVYAR